MKLLVKREYFFNSHYTDAFGCAIFQAAQAAGLPVKSVDPDEIELITGELIHINFEDNYTVRNMYKRASGISDPRSKEPADFEMEINYELP